MKKTLLLLSFAALCSQSASALFKIGPEVGLNFNKMKYDLSTGLAGLSYKNQSVMGAKIGLLADIGLGPIAVQPGIFYSMKGGKQSVNFLGSVENRTTINYLEVPVWVLYKHKLGPGKIFGGVAPSIGYGLSGKTKSKASVLGQVEEDTQNLTFGSDSTDVKRIDYAINIGVGYQLFMGLFARVSYSIGLANLSNDASAGDIKNRSFGVSVGWLFGK